MAVIPGAARNLLADDGSGSMSRFLAAPGMTIFN